jgi:hypothetical protein
MFKKGDAVGGDCDTGVQSDTELSLAAGGASSGSSAGAGAGVGAGGATPKRKGKVVEPEPYIQVRTPGGVATGPCHQLAVHADGSTLLRTFR